MSQQGFTLAAVFYNYDQDKYLLLTPNESDPANPTWSWTGLLTATRWGNISDFNYYLTETSLGAIPGPWQFKWIYFDTAVTP